MNTMIEVRDLSKKFVKHLDIAAKLAQRLGADVREEVVHAVDHVSFFVGHGEVVGLVGESGCGKSTVGRRMPARSFSKGQMSPPWTWPPIKRRRYRSK